MNLLNATKFPAAVTMGLESSGRELLVVLVKATFALPADGGEPVAGLDQSLTHEQWDRLTRAFIDAA